MAQDISENVSHLSHLTTHTGRHVPYIGTFSIKHGILFRLTIRTYYRSLSYYRRKQLHIGKNECIIKTFSDSLPIMIEDREPELCAEVHGLYCVFF